MDTMLVRRHTGYKDKNGKPIIEGDTLQGWFAAPWDNEQPILRNFRVCKESGRWWCHGVETQEEDDFLSNMLYLEHKST
jgi:hypothetical protein